MADPPWDVQQKGKNSLGAERHYNLMTLDQIKAMPIADLADPESSHCWPPSGTAMTCLRRGASRPAAR